MPSYRVAKRFTVESGHMLSLHPERCRFPHGHTRVIEIVIEGDELNPQGMLVDFKALKLALESYVDRYDHSMAVNSNDPAYAALQQSFPDQAFVVFSAEEPTTERIARDIYDFAAHILKDGFQSGPYRIEKGKNRVARVRVGETPSSWAEYGD